MPQLSFKIDKRFFNKVKGRFGGYEFDVGILKDGPYFLPKSKKAGLGTFNGKPRRKTSTKQSGLKLSEVSTELRKKIDFYRRPFERDTKDYKSFRKEFISFLMQKGGKRYRVIALLRAMVRNPFIKGRYGKNAPSTVRAKGFNRFGIDTGQTYTAITARMAKKRV